MKIGLLYFVLDDDVAAQKNFLGSPSIRVDGVELWDEKRDVYSMGCRVTINRLR